MSRGADGQRPRRDTVDAGPAPGQERAQATPFRVIPIPCPFGAGSTVYVYYLDTPRPALVDTGVAGSPARVIEPALAAAGIQLSDVRWLLATHGHWDHIGGAHAARQRGAGDIQLALHEADAVLLRDRRAHLRGYAGVRFRFLDDPAALAAQDALLFENISGELGAERSLRGGERLDLGGGFVAEVVHTPGHSPGSVTFVVESGGARLAFTGDAMQVAGSAGGRFPLFVDPAAYRATQRRLLEDVRPDRLYTGHRFLDLEGRALPEQIVGDDVSRALRASIQFEQRLEAAAARVRRPDGALPTAHDFAPAAEALGNPADNPSAWPGPFFTTLGGYLGLDWSAE